MVVYEDTATANKTLKYRTWDGSTWSSEQTLDYSSVAEGGADDVSVWIELDARSQGDEIMLGWQDKTGLGYYGAVWDGGNWVDTALINGAGVSINEQSFDIAWEGTSDQGMYAYGTGTTTDYSVYDVSAGTWTDGSGSINTAGAVVWLMIDGDPNSDYIAMIVIDTLSTSTADVNVDMWNGSNWTTVSTPTEDTDINTYGFSRGADVAWESNASDRALFVWRDGTTDELSLRYMVYDISANQFQALDDDDVCDLTGTHVNQQVTSLANAENANGPCSGLGTWSGTVSGIVAAADRSSQKIAVLAENQTVLDVKPEMQLWNGDANGTWLTQTANMGDFEPDAALGTLPTATISTKSYAFVFRVSNSSTLTQSSYGWFANANDVQPGSALASENNATSVAVGTAVRLRNGLTVGGGVLSASGQQFKLQSATATSGPWYDVVNSGELWWNSGYDYRKKITVTTTSATPTGFSVMLTIDHATLVGSGKSQADGDDLRIIYTGGGSPTEIDRVLEDGSSWNDSSTKIWFKTQSSIGLNSSDSNYYIYYGDSSATSPPVNPANVFMMYDDFGDNDVSDWTNRETADTTWSVSGGVLDGTVSTFGGNSHELSHTIGTHSNAVIEARVQPQGDVSADHYQGFTGIRRSSAGAGYFLVSADSSNSQQLIAESSSWNNETTNASFAETLSTGTWYRQKFSAVGTTLSGKTWQDGTAEPGSWESTVTDATYASGTEVSLGVGWAANDHIKFDWVRVRSAVTTDPTTATGSEIDETNIAWVFKNNGTPTDGTVITTTLLSGSSVKETYEEDNPTASNLNAIPDGSQGEWDFSLDSTGALATTYYFRMAKSDGSDLDIYTVYPQITISSGGETPTTEQLLRHGTWFNSSGIKQSFNL
jgi:hypothetical protein